MVFGGVTCVGALFTIFVVKETKGLTRKELKQLYDSDKQFDKYFDLNQSETDSNY